MKGKSKIQKILILTAWAVVIGGITTLLVAANRKHREHLCKEVLINIKGDGENYYIEKGDVQKTIDKTANGTLIQRPVVSIDLLKLEKALEGNSWIKNAELYFDSQDALHVLVEEREPIARVFTTGGSSFYIDSSAQKMPLLEKVSARVPVVTGFTDAKKWTANDSSLLIQAKQIAQYINGNEFWSAQVGEIDINDQGSFELIPTIGDHIIKIGSAENINEKLNRLFIFYKQVLSKVGFNKYKIVDVEYDGQVIGVNKGSESQVDSIQLQKNIEELFRNKSLQNIDEEMLPGEFKSIAKKDSTTSLIKQDSSTVKPIEQIPVQNPKSNTSKTSSLSNPGEKPDRTKTNQKPKAVMSRRKN